MSDPNIPIIKPTVGRKLWYWPTPAEKSWSHDQPFDATIVHVLSDRQVNLHVINEVGYIVPAKEGVVLLQPDMKRDPIPGECSWMPFQVGQARALADVGTTGDAASSATPGSAG